MVIITVGVVAIIEAQRSFVVVNNWSTHEATGTYLANELRERMRTLPRHDPVTGLALVTSGGSTSLQTWGRETGEDQVVDFNDIDDYDGIRFGDAALPSGSGTFTVFQGPIDAFGRIISEIDENGAVLTTLGVPVSLRGWAQTVQVTKVDPYDYSVTRARDYADALRPVNAWPLRVTVTVWFQDTTMNQAEEVVRVSWIVPATK